MTYEEFKESAKGAALAPMLGDPKVVAAMETLSQRGMPAVAALDEVVAERVGNLDHVERQQVGRWIRDILAQRGWRPVAKKRLSAGRSFASGAVYAPIARPQPDAGPRRGGPANGLAQAQALLRDAAPQIGTVDAFLAGRRAMWGDE